MKLNVSYLPPMKDFVQMLANESGGDSEHVAILISGKSDDGRSDFYNLALPVDFQADPKAPYFDVGNIRIVVENKELAFKINTKQLVERNGMLYFI